MTPESASSTLSRMSCEKLKSMPGKARNFAASSSSIFSPGHPRPPLLHRPQRDVELEVEEAGDVGAVVGPADVRHDAPDLGDRGDDLAEPRGHPGGLLERDGPRQHGADPEVALLQLGHELAPRPAPRCTVKASSPPVTARVSKRWSRTAVQGPDVRPLHRPVHQRLLLLRLVVEQERAEHRRQRHGEQQRPEDREGVGAGHRPEQRPGRPGHGEQRQEGADDDHRREEQGPLDPVRRLGDPVDQRPAAA